MPPPVLGPLPLVGYFPESRALPRGSSQAGSRKNCDARGTGLGVKPGCVAPGPCLPSLRCSFLVCKQGFRPQACHVGIQLGMAVLLRGWGQRDRVRNREGSEDVARLCGRP